MKKAIFIRHGATRGNLEKRYVGRTDEGLCEEGKEQTRALARTLDIIPDALFVSPQRRARETAFTLFPSLAQTVVYDLREMDFGDFEYKTALEMKNDPSYRAWVEGNCEGDVPGGESVRGFKARAVRAVKECLDDLPDGKTAAIVSHGGVIMAALAALSEDPRLFYDYYLQNASAFICREEKGGLKILEKV